MEFFSKSAEQTIIIYRPLKWDVYNNMYSLLSRSHRSESLKINRFKVVYIIMYFILVSLIEIVLSQYFVELLIVQI